MRMYNTNPNRDPNIWWHRTLWEDLEDWGNRHISTIGHLTWLLVVAAVILWVVFT